MNAQLENSQNNGRVTITLQNPTASSITDIISVPGAVVQVAFDLADSSLARDGDNLLLTAENGGEIRLLDYFKAEENNLPDFILADGSTVAGADFLKSMNPDMDISATAGPAEEESSIDGSGIGEYLSDANALIDGVDRLDGLGTRYWDSDTKVSEYITAEGLESDTTFEAPFNPPFGPPVEPPIEPPFKPPVEPPSGSPTNPPSGPPDVPPSGPPSGPQVDPPPDPPSGPPDVPPSGPPSGPSTDPPSGPPSGPRVDPPSNPPSEPPSGPPADPPSGPPDVSPSGPPSGPPTDPPSNPPSEPPSGPPANPPSGPPDVPPDPPVTDPYQARAVLYKTDPDQNNTDNNTVQFRILSDGEPVKPSDTVSDLSFTAENNYFKNFSFDPATGIATFELSDEGLAALLAAGSANIYDYITFNYMVNGQPKTYTMQLVVNQDNNYNSAAEDALNAPDGGSPVWGEWHTESKGAADGNRVTSQGNDETWFSSRGTGDDAFHGDLSTQAGNDTLWFNGRVYESNVDMGSGNNIATITSESHDNDWYGMQNSHITAGTGQNSLYIKNTNVAGNTSSGIDAGSGSSVDFSRGHDGIINITVDRGDAGGTAQGIGAESDSGGTSLAIKGDADSRIFIDARSNAGNARGVYVKGNNTITMEGGDIDVNATGGRVTYGMYAQSRGKLQVDAAGKLSVTANSANGDKDSVDGVLGVFAYERSAMDINAHEVEVKATSAHGHVHGVSAQRNSHVNITSHDKVSITATVGNSDSSSQANGIGAALRGDLTITGSHIDIKAVSDAGSALGVYSEASGEITLQGHNGKNNTIDIHARGGSSRGVQTNGASSVAYIKGGDKDDVINITAESSGSGDAVGVEGILRSNIVITGGAGNDTLNVKALNNGSGNAVGTRVSHRAGTGNSVNEDGNVGPDTGGNYEVRGVEKVSIEAKANGGSATGMFNSYGYQTIKDSKGALDFSVKAETNGTGTADGMFAHVGKNSVIGNSVAGQDADSFTIQSRTANGAATGMRAFQGGENSITGGASGADKLNLVAVAGGSGAATGLLAYGDGKNTVSNVENIFINAKSAGGDAAGLVAKSAGVNTINNSDRALNLTIKAATQGNGEADAIFANGGKNIISGSSGSTHGDDSFTIKAESVNGHANGLRVWNDGLNSITGGSGHADALNIAATASGSGFATGLESAARGQNQISGVESVTVAAKSNTGSAVGLSADGGVNSIDNTQLVTITAQSEKSSAKGLVARGLGDNETGGQNTITGNTVSINAHAAAYADNAASATGLYADRGGRNTINGETVDVNADGTYAGGLYAGNAGINAVSAKNISVNVQSLQSQGDPKVFVLGGAATGLAADNGSNILSGDNVSVAVSSTINATGMIASGSAGTNTVTGKNVSIAVTAAGPFGNGMIATNGGSNSVSGEKVDLSVSADPSTHGSSALPISRAMSAVDGSKNTIYGRDVSVKIMANTVEALVAEKDSSNTITGSNTLSVRAQGAYSAEGLLAQHGGSNTLTGKEVSISTQGGSHAFGLTTQVSGSNTVTGDTVSISAKGDTYTGIGLLSRGGSNTVTGNTVSVSARGATEATGLSAGRHNNIDTINNINSITGHNVSVSATATSSQGSASVLQAGVNGNNDIRSSGTVTLEAKANGQSYGLRANGTNGKNSVEAGGSVDISAISTNSDAYGVFASANNAINAITSDTVSISAQGGKSSEAHGLRSLNGGSNSVIGDTVSISAKAGGSVSGIYAREANAKNTVTGDNISVSAHGNSLGYALSARNGGENDIIGKDVTLNAQGDNTYATGLFAQNGGARNSITADNVSITANTEGHGFGLFSSGAGTANTITAHHVSVSGQGNGLGYGLLAELGATNTITSDNVSVSARSTGNMVYGLAASGGSINTISGSESGMTVTITANSGAAQSAIAMWAKGGGTVNYITGHSQAGGHGDSITLNASGGRGVAMHASEGGRNIISTGDGNDSVTINGAVNGSGNEINVGGGRNTVTLNGAVTAGSLNVHADSGGSYTLTLQAANAQDFVSKYGSWLNAIGANSLITSGLQSINFAGLGASDLSAFLHEFNDLLWNMKEHVAIMPPSLADMLHDPAVPPVHAGLNISEEMYDSPVAANAQWEAAHQNYPESQSILPAMVAMAATVDSGAGGHDFVNSWHSIQADTSQAHHFPDVDPAAVAGGNGAENTVIGVADAHNDVLEVLLAPEVHDPLSAGQMHVLDDNPAVIGVADAQNNVLDVLPAPEVHDLLLFDTVADVDGHDALPLDFTDMGGALPEGEWLHVEDQSGVTDGIPGAEMLAEESVHDGQLYLADENSLGDVWPALITDVRDDDIEKLLTTPAVETLVVNNDEVSDLELLLDNGTGVAAAPGVEQNPVSSAIVDVINDSAFTALATDESLMLYIQQLVG